MSHEIEVGKDYEVHLPSAWFIDRDPCLGTVIGRSDMSCDVVHVRLYSSKTIMAMASWLKEIPRKCLMR